MYFIIVVFREWNELLARDRNRFVAWIAYRANHRRALYSISWQLVQDWGLWSNIPDSPLQIGNSYFTWWEIYCLLEVLPFNFRWDRGCEGISLVGVGYREKRGYEQQCWPEQVQIGLFDVLKTKITRAEQCLGAVISWRVRPHAPSTAVVLSIAMKPD